MIFWFGGMLGALLVAVGLFMLIQRVRTGSWVFLAGLALGALLIPALGLFRESQAYLITGLVGVGLLLLGIFIAPRVRRAGPGLVGLGAVLATFLLPYFNLTQPWNTNPMALISGTPTTAAPVGTIQPAEPTPLTPPADTSTPAPATPDPNAPAAPATPTLPEQSTLPTEPSSPSTAQPPTQTEQPQAMQPSPPAQTDVPQPTPSVPTTPGAAPNQPVGAVESNQLCPCVLRVSSGISDATVVLSKDGRELSRQTGAQVVFSNLEMGAYSLSVEALGHQTFTTPLQVSNNKDLTVYLLRQQ